MPIPVNYGIVAANLNATGIPDPAITTCGFLIEGGSAGFDQADADTISGIVATMVKPFMSSAWTYLGATCYVGLADGNAVFESVASAGAGTDDPAASPPNVSWLVHKRTARGGRRGIGRMYIPGVAEGNVNGAGGILSGTVTARNANMATFLSAMDAAGFPPALVIAAEAEADQLTTIITSFVVDPVVATQRRRLR